MEGKMSNSGIFLVVVPMDLLRGLFMVFALTQLVFAYRVGTGVADVTGLCGNIQMMGYADMNQQATGIHMRLKSRAFIFEYNGKSVVFVVVDAAMTSYYVKRQVVKKIASILGPDLYTNDNVCLSATHTHSSPGGDNDLIVYQLAHFGFHPEKAENTIHGIAQSIIKAHSQLQEAALRYIEGPLYGAHINRVPKAYLENPKQERQLYCSDETLDTMTDPMMRVLRITAEDESWWESSNKDTGNKDLGLIGFFAVHPTSLNNTNHYISGDNKGIASYLVEKSALINADFSKTNSTTKSSSTNAEYTDGFVAAFPLPPSGDVSPNTGGAFCLDSGKSCLVEPTLCEGGIKMCHGRGPAYDQGDLASARVIGQKMAAKAIELYEKAEAQPPLLGPINYRSIRVNMTSVRIDPLISSRYNNVSALNRMRTCKPAMGYGFAAGTIDGPGLSYFHQGDKHPQHYLWDTLRNLLREPSAQQAKCHFPKPILISGGEINIPYAWLPEVIELQVFRIGSLFILTNPSEITTMAGRRIIKAMRTLISGFLGDTEDIIVLLTTISNGYSSYLTTFEEYQAQRYEGSSTLYGPYSLDAYILQYTKLVKSLLVPSEGTTESDVNQVMIPNQSDQYLQLSRFVQSDQLPFFSKFGDILKDVRANYRIGEKVQVTFQGANPSNYFSKIKSFLYVQRKGTSCSGGMREAVDEKADFQCNVYWEDVFDDFDDCTLFDWRYTSSVWAISEVTLCWTIPLNTINGMYRIVYNGMQRTQENTFIPFQGISSTFHVNRA